MKCNTVKEATELWVGEFSAIPQSLIEKAYFVNGQIDEFTEITPPTANDRVYCFGENSSGEITKVIENGKYEVKLDNNKTVVLETDEFDVERDDILPMWGTMWMFKECLDNMWLEEDGGLQAMADCGFRVFECEEGYIFGIDGAGYDFYEAHWIPLYLARGL